MAEVQRQDRAPVTYQFLIAGPLLAWQRTEGSGKVRFNSRQQKAFQKMVALLCLEARNKNGERMIPQGVPVRLTVRVFYPRPKSMVGFSVWKTSKPDLDNLVKTIKDALNGVAYHDDSQVCQDGGSSKQYSTQPITVEYAHVEIAELQ